MSDADRERDLRRLERDRRRREQGRPTYFDEPGSGLQSWPLAADFAEQSTMVLRPEQLGRDGPTDGAAPPEQAHRRRLAVSTAIFAAATGLSRILGLVREVVASYYFGAAGKINAFTVAYQIPNLVRALVADAALSSAFVPVFSELLEKGDRKRAWRVASSLFWLMLLGLGALTAIYLLIAPWVIGFFGDPGGDATLAVGLSRVLFPIVMLLGVSGVVVGSMNLLHQSGELHQSGRDRTRSACRQHAGVMPTRRFLSLPTPGRAPAALPGRGPGLVLVEVVGRELAGAAHQMGRSATVSRKSMNRPTVMSKWDVVPRWMVCTA